MDTYLSMDFDEFINTNLFDSNFGALGSVSSEDERSDLLKKWLKNQIRSSDASMYSELENYHSALSKYIEKIDVLHKKYYDRFQLSKYDTIEQALACATFCMLSGYRSVLIDYKSDIITKMNEISCTI